MAFVALELKHLTARDERPHNIPLPKSLLHDDQVFSSSAPSTLLLCHLALLTALSPTAALLLVIVVQERGRSRSSQSSSS